MKLTEEQRRDLDADVLRAISTRHGNATYVIRNSIDWPGERWHKSRIGTPDVLRSCNRLVNAGLVQEVYTSYAVMKAWGLTVAGRETLRTSQDKGEPANG